MVLPYLNQTTNLTLESYPKFMLLNVFDAQDIGRYTIFYRF